MSYIGLTDFSKSSNNLPDIGTDKLRNRFLRWRSWRSQNPYEEILDQEANREINAEEWTQESNIDEYESIEEGFEEIDLGDITEAPLNEDLDIPFNEGSEIIDLTEGTPLFESSGAAAASGSVLAKGFGTSPRALGPPPYDRPNWERMNEGQKRYAMEQWQLARVRRGLPIDHPHPGLPEPIPSATAEPKPEPDPEPQSDPISPLPSPPSSFPDIEPDFENQPSSPLFSEEGSPFRADIPDSDEDMADVSTSGLQTTPKRVNPDESSSGGSGRKRARMSLPGTAGGQGASADPVASSNSAIPKPMSSGQHNLRHYKKVHRFISFGLAYSPISIERTQTVGEEEHKWNDVFMMTPLAEIPWDRLFMYLNPSEYSLLPPGSRVTHMKCSIRSENVRIAFPTNSTTSNLATLNQNKFLRIGHNLRQNLRGVNVHPKTFTDAKPMIVSAIDEQKNDGTDYANYVRAFYGSPNDGGEDNPVFATQTPVHQFGRPYPLQYYYAQVTQDVDPNKSGWPTFQSFISEFEADGFAGKKLTSVEYSPSVGIIKAPLTNIYTGIPSTYNGAHAIHFQAGTGSTAGLHIEVTGEKGLLNGKIEDNRGYETKTMPTFDLQQIIEKSQQLVAGLRPTIYKPKTVPSLHVGLEPVIALSSPSIDNTTIQNYTDAQAYFEVVCECTIDTAYPTYRPHATIANVVPSDVVWNYFNSGAPIINASMFDAACQTQKPAA